MQFLLILLCKLQGICAQMETKRGTLSSQWSLQVVFGSAGCEHLFRTNILSCVQEGSERWTLAFLNNYKGPWMCSMQIFIKTDLLISHNWIVIGHLLFFPYEILVLLGCTTWSVSLVYTARIHLNSSDILNHLTRSV